MWLFPLLHASTHIPRLQRWDAGKCSPMLANLLSTNKLDVKDKRVLIPGCGCASPSIYSVITSAASQVQPNCHETHKYLPVSAAFGSVPPDNSASLISISLFRFHTHSLHIYHFAFILLLQARLRCLLLRQSRSCTSSRPGPVWRGSCRSSSRAGPRVSSTPS